MTDKNIQEEATERNITLTNIKQHEARKTNHSQTDSEELDSQSIDEVVPCSVDSFPHASADKNIQEIINNIIEKIYPNGCWNGDSTKLRRVLEKELNKLGEMKK